MWQAVWEKHSSQFIARREKRMKEGELCWGRDALPKKYDGNGRRLYFDQQSRTYLSGHSQKCDDTYTTSFAHFLLFLRGSFCMSRPIFLLYRRNLNKVVSSNKLDLFFLNLRPAGGVKHSDSDLVETRMLSAKKALR